MAGRAGGAGHQQRGPTGCHHRQAGRDDSIAGNGDEGLFKVDLSVSGVSDEVDDDRVVRLPTVLAEQQAKGFVGFVGLNQADVEVLPVAFAVAPTEDI